MKVHLYIAEHLIEGVQCSCCRHFYQVTHWHIHGDLYTLTPTNDMFNRKSSLYYPPHYIYKWRPCRKRVEARFYISYYFYAGAVYGNLYIVRGMSRVDCKLAGQPNMISLLSVKIEAKYADMTNNKAVLQHLKRMCYQKMIYC